MPMIGTAKAKGNDTMKLAVFDIGGLSRDMLTRVSLPALNRFKIFTMKSSIPCIPEVASHTMWTGLNPTRHGVLGLSDTDTVMNVADSPLAAHLRANGLEVYTGSQLPNDTGQYDVVFIQSNGLANGRNSKKAGREISDMIDSVPTECPTLIVSSYGLAKYDFCLSVDTFLITKELFKPQMPELSGAWPTRYQDGEVRQEFGIHVKHSKSAYLITPEIIGCLNKIRGVTAYYRSLYYDMDGDRFGDTPEIVIESPGGHTFISSGYRPTHIFDGCGDIFPSPLALFATNVPDFVFSLHSVSQIEHVTSYICEFLGLRCMDSVEAEGVVTISDHGSTNEC